MRINNREYTVGIVRVANPTELWHKEQQTMAEPSGNLQIFTHEADARQHPDGGMAMTVIAEPPFPDMDGLAESTGMTFEPSLISNECVQDMHAVPPCGANRQDVARTIAAVYASQLRVVHDTDGAESPFVEPEVRVAESINAQLNDALAGLEEVSAELRASIRGYDHKIATTRASIRAAAAAASLTRLLAGTYRPYW